MNPILLNPSTCWCLELEKSLAVLWGSGMPTSWWKPSKRTAWTLSPTIGIWINLVSVDVLTVDLVWVSSAWFVGSPALITFEMLPCTLAQSVIVLLKHTRKSSVINSTLHTEARKITVDVLLLIEYMRKINYCNRCGWIDTVSIAVTARLVSNSFKCVFAA